MEAAEPEAMQVVVTPWRMYCWTAISVAWVTSSLDAPGMARVTTVITTEDKHVCVAATRYGRFACYDVNGKLLSQWGAVGDEPGVSDNAHQIDVDNEGNFYVADANNNRVQKFVPKKNANKAQLIGKELVLKK